MIKDSGDRKQFDTGAVRDMRTGKGRCDLLPLEVVQVLVDKDNILTNISTFQTNGDTAYLYAALHWFIEMAYNNSCETAILEVAKHFEEGAEKYGEYNWQKGVPVYCYLDSAIRHYMKWRRGDQDESHDRAFVWNMLCCIWEVDYHDKD